MNLQEFLKEVGGKESQIISYTSVEESLEAVKRNGDALQYVKEQTEQVCLEAVKEEGDALKYVNKKVFIQSIKAE